MVLELLDAGEDVIVLDNLSTGSVWRCRMRSSSSRAMSAIRRFYAGCTAPPPNSAPFLPLRRLKAPARIGSGGLESGAIG
jgi:hypothetical protein